MKELSCGIIILNEYDEILMGHSTGNTFYDLPKGGIEDGETHLQCALRECLEETGLDFTSSPLIEIGMMKYNKKKDLFLFLAHVLKLSIDFDMLACTTHFDDGERQHPEFDGYHWVTVDEVEEMCTINMARVIHEFLDNNEFGLINEQS